MEKLWKNYRKNKKYLEGVHRPSQFFFFEKSITEENIFLLKKIEKMLKFGQKTDNLVNSTEKTQKVDFLIFPLFCNPLNTSLEKNSKNENEK